MDSEKIKTVTDILTGKLGQNKVVIDNDILEKYSRDETADLSFFPDLLVRADNVNDVSMVLNICNEYGVPVIPRGAGTGVTGGAVPVAGGVVLSLENMNKIIEIDDINMVAIVEPGAITGEIQSKVLEYGLMYPPDPASLENCSIGGNVAENAGGPRAVKYGTTKDYILGLEFVMPDGTILSTGGKLVKNVTGYNLTGLLLGSEGTLAVVTKIYLRLIPAPVVTKDLLIPFESIDDAIDTVYLILKNRIIPDTMEFMEDNAIKLVSKFFNNDIPFPDAGAHLLIQISGENEEVVYDNLERISKLLDMDHNEIFAAESNLQRDKLWKARRSIREAIHAEDLYFLAEDSVVPRSEIPQFLKDLKKYFSSMGLKSVMFGHAGDGNVHIDVLKGSLEYDEWKKLQPSIKKEIYKRAIALGGTITGEHGIGYTRKDYIHLAMSEGEIELHKRIKKAFDPNYILNPKKIF